MGFYEKIGRPLLYSFKPETIHALVAGTGELTAKTPFVGRLVENFLQVSDPLLQTDLCGIPLKNPIGLSAGFDKNGNYLRFIGMMGFGFLEVGSITGTAYKGNPKPHVRRLVKNKSLVINYGLKNDGAHTILPRLQKSKSSIPFGVSIAKTNLPEFTGQKAIDDYLHVYKLARAVGMYDTINISCPNTYDGTPFTDPAKLSRLLSGIAKIRKEYAMHKPVFLKINPDLDLNVVDMIVALAETHGISGFVIGNLLKDRKRFREHLTRQDEYDHSWPGGISGKPTRSVSTEMIRYVAKKTRGKLAIIGCGGVFTGDDAYEKIRAGASAIQLITGFIYGGPLTIRNINLRLKALLQRDGFDNIKQAVGADLSYGAS